MTEFTIVEREAQTAAAVFGEETVDNMPAFFGKAFHKVMVAVEKAGVTIVGPPFGYYPEMPTDKVALEAGFPTSGAVDDGDVHTLILPAGQAVEALHVGPYETLKQTYAELFAWTSSQDLELGKAMWEYYLTDPNTNPDPATWETRIVWPLADQ